MIKLKIRTLCLLLALPFCQLSIAAPTGQADVTGILTAVNVATREITVDETKFRVSLSARIDMPEEKRVVLEKVRSGGLVELYLDQDSGDVRDLVVVVYP